MKSKSKKGAHLLLEVILGDRDVADDHIGKDVPSLVHLRAAAPAAVLLLPCLHPAPWHHTHIHIKLLLPIPTEVQHALNSDISKPEVLDK